MKYKLKTETILLRAIFKIRGHISVGDKSMNSGTVPGKRELDTLPASLLEIWSEAKGPTSLKILGENNFHYTTRLILLTQIN